LIGLHKLRAQDQVHPCQQRTVYFTSEQRHCKPHQFLHLPWLHVHLTRRLVLPHHTHCSRCSRLHGYGKYVSASHSTSIENDTLTLRLSLVIPSTLLVEKLACLSHRQGNLQDLVYQVQTHSNGRGTDDLVLWATASCGSLWFSSRSLVLRSRSRPRILCILRSPLRLSATWPPALLSTRWSFLRSICGSLESTLRSIASLLRPRIRLLIICGCDFHRFNSGSCTYVVISHWPAIRIGTAGTVVNSTHLELVTSKNIPIGLGVSSEMRIVLLFVEFA
jgi:hypothetical protein